MDNNTNSDYSGCRYDDKKKINIVMINNRYNIGVVLLLLLLGGCFFFVRSVFTAEENGNINVQFTVPTTTTGGGGGGTSDGIPPVISDIASVSSFTTATVSWVATDNIGVMYCTFDYGPTGSYGFSGGTNFSGSNFYVSLTGLTTGTPYYFLITCADQSNLSTATGTFMTLSAEFQNKLTIIAKPEKRVPKTGGNLDLDVTLVLYDSVSKSKVFTYTTAINSIGSSTLQNIGAPTGNFEAVLKGQSHLAKKIIGVSLENGIDAVLDFSDAGIYALLAGDVQGTGLKDNYVDILDISAEDIKFNSTNLEFDLNRDGIVDVLDMSAILVNYNKKGDPVS